MLTNDRLWRRLALWIVILLIVGVTALAVIANTNAARWRAESNGLWTQAYEQVMTERAGGMKNPP